MDRQEPKCPVCKFSTIPLFLYYFVYADFVNSDAQKGEVKLK